MEGTDLYESLAMAITEYAMKKGEYDSRLEQLRELYKDKEGYTGEEGANTRFQAELVGDYLFTDKQFVEKLINEDRGLFNWIRKEINYLHSLATAGSKEARLLEKSKKMFAEVVREASKDGVKNPTSEGGVKYDLAKIENVTPSKATIKQNLQDVTNMESVYTVDKSKLDDSGKNIKEIYQEFFDEWGENLHSDVFCDIATRKSSIGSEFTHGNTAEKIASIEAIPSVIENGKIIDWFEKHKGLFRITVAAPIKIGNKTYYMGVMLQRDNQNQRLYIHDVIIEEEVSSRTEDHLSTTGPSESNKNLFVTNILKKLRDVKGYSITDSDGNQLSAYQMEFFQDSKIRDKNGNLKVMYHGSPAAFTIFDKKKARSGGYYGKGFYFADSDSHAKQYGNAYKVYLNITNPLQDGTNNITKDQLRNFVEAIAENEDYGIDNYGYGATVDGVVDSVYGKSDFAMLMDLNASSIGNMVEAIELFNEVNGTDYDGIIALTETVAFYPNQIKSVTNTNPTKNEDINLSLSYDKQSETTGGGWNVRGQDVSLPVAGGYQESPVAVDASEQVQAVNIPGLEKSQPQSQGKAQKANLPMPEQTQPKAQKVNLPGLESTVDQERDAKVLAQKSARTISVFSIYRLPGDFLRA